MLAWARGQGFRGVQLNAATPGVRPRDLDRSGRRDLAATLRRHDLICSGLDLWIPPEHFCDPAHADRAVASVLLALDLAHELAMLAGGSVVSTAAVAKRPTICVSLVLAPDTPADVVAVLADRSRARVGDRGIADHAWPARDMETVPLGIGIGIDPATLIMHGDDPATAAARLGSRIASARLTDAAKAGAVGVGGRVVPGSRGGALDVLAYTVGLATAGYRGMLVVDVRGLTGHAAAVRAALDAVTSGG